MNIGSAVHTRLRNNELLIDIQFLDTNTVYTLYAEQAMALSRQIQEAVGLGVDQGQMIAIPGALVDSMLDVLKEVSLGPQPYSNCHSLLEKRAEKADGVIEKFGRYFQAAGQRKHSLRLDKNEELG